MNSNNTDLCPIVKLPINSSFSVRTLGHINYDIKWKHFPRKADEYILFFVVSGNLYIEEDGIQYHVKQNEALLLEPGKHHVGFLADTVSYYYIHFSCSSKMDTILPNNDLKQHIQKIRANLVLTSWNAMWEYHESDFSDLFFPKHGHLGGSYGYFQALAEMDRVFFEGLEGRRRFVSLRLEEILIMLCRSYANECINPNSTKTQTLVRRMQVYLNDNYAHPITSETITTLFELNYDYLNRQFKAHTGQPIHDYLLTIRINKAKDLIKSGIKIREVAALVGIEDTAYFSKLFKKVTGVSPSEYAHKNYQISRE